MSQKNIMEYETVDIDIEKKELLIIDQTKLPGTTEILRLSTAKEIWDAIYLLQVRGAPAIGVSAAFGIYILATQIEADDFDSFYAEFAAQRDYLDSCNSLWQYHFVFFCQKCLRNRKNGTYLVANGTNLTISVTEREIFTEKF